MRHAYGSSPNTSGLTRCWGLLPCNTSRTPWVACRDMRSRHLRGGGDVGREDCVGRFAKIGGGGTPQTLARPLVLRPDWGPLPRQMSRAGMAISPKYLTTAPTAAQQTRVGLHLRRGFLNAGGLSRGPSGRLGARNIRGWRSWIYREWHSDHHYRAGARVHAARHPTRLAVRGWTNPITSGG